MVDLVQTSSALPTLTNPLLLHAFAGRMGSSGAATLDYLATQWEARLVAEVDPDTLYDFSVLRPVRHSTEGGYALSWPTMRLMHARPSGAERDVLLLVGPEPHLRWRNAADELAQLVATLGCTEAVHVLGFNGTTPHTRPAPVQLFDATSELATRFDVRTEVSEYEGPVGFGTTLVSTLGARGITTATLVTLSPFYLGLDPAPHAVLGIVRAVDRALGVTTDVAELEEQRTQVDERALEALARNDEFRALLANLEQQHDAAVRALTTGSSFTDDDAAAIATEVDAFLRGYRSQIEDPRT